MTKISGFVLVGQLGSGKGYAAKYLKRKGFKVYSFYEEILSCLKNRGVLSPARAQLQDEGDRLRKKYGLDYIAKCLFDQATRDHAKKVVFDGARNPGEVKYLKSKGIVALGITAPINTRFRRIITRADNRDAMAWNQFLTAHRRDMGIGQPINGQRVRDTLKLVNVKIHNNGTLNELYRQMDRLISNHKPNKVRRHDRSIH